MPLLLCGMFVQACAGLVLAACIAAAGFRLRALTLSGAIAATGLGGLIFTAGGFAWSALLLLFFVTSSGLSRLHRRPEGVVAKGGRRDAGQVLANGGIPSLLALVALLASGPNWYVPYTGALAAATADTWATEIGRLSKAEPRLITTGRRVRPGTSGGVTSLGLAASAVGASVVAGAAALTGIGGEAIAVLIAGIVGSVLDSVLGATIQEIRHCPVCLTATEQVHHAPCGTRTIVSSGIRGLNNDGVNAVISVASALLAALLASLARRM